MDGRHLEKRCGHGWFRGPRIHRISRSISLSISGISHGIRLWLDAALQRMLTRGFLLFVHKRGSDTSLVLASFYRAIWGFREAGLISDNTIYFICTLAEIIQWPYQQKAMC